MSGRDPLEELAQAQLPTHIFIHAPPARRGTPIKTTLAVFGVLCIVAIIGVWIFARHSRQNVDAKYGRIQSRRLKASTAASELQSYAITHHGRFPDRMSYGQDGDYTYLGDSLPADPHGQPPMDVIVFYGDSEDGVRVIGLSSGYAETCFTAEDWSNAWNKHNEILRGLGAPPRVAIPPF